MALPSSGALTLSNIQTEFGGSNPIQLNEYYAGGSYVAAGTIGTYGSVPSSGAIGIRNFYGTSNITAFSYNFSGLSGATNTTPFGNSYASVLNSTGKLYTTGTYSTYPYSASLASRVSTLLSGTGTSIDIKAGTATEGSCVIDSSDNFYALYVIVGKLGVTKYNSSGTHVWSYLTSANSSVNRNRNKILSISSSGNIYIGGNINTSTRGYITKITSTTSPVIAWTRSIYTGSNPQATVSAVTTDSSDNVYATGEVTNTSTGVTLGFLIKYNTSGTLQWQRRINVGLLYSLYTNNTTGDTFVCGVNYFAKYNSSGVVQWQKTISSPTVYYNDITQSSSGNIYLCGEIIPWSYISVIKLDSTGAVVWQRRIVLNAYSMSLDNSSVIVDASETYIYLTASITQTKLSGGTSDTIGMVLKLKTDGTGTGTFTNNLVSGRTAEYTYSATSDSFANASVDSAGSFTFASVTTTISSDFTNGAYDTNVPINSEIFTNSVVTVV